MKKMYIYIGSNYTKEHIEAMAELIRTVFNGLIISENRASGTGFSFVVGTTEKTEKILKALLDADCLYCELID